MIMTYDVETRLEHSLRTPYSHGGMIGTSCASIEATDQYEERKIMKSTKETKPRRSGYAKAHLQGDALQCYDLEVENREIIEAYDKYKNGGQKEWDDYVVIVYEKLKNLIKDHIGMYHFSQSGAEFEDLFAEGKVAIFERILTYDPRQSMPSSYFGPKIDELLRKCSNGASHMTDHYISMFKQLNEAARELGHKDCLSSDLDPVTLSILTGLSLATVNNTLEQAKIHLNLLSDYDDETLHKHLNKQASPYLSSPEYIYQRKEDSLLISSAFESLDEYEQFIFSKLEIETYRDKKGTEKRWTPRKLAKLLSEDKELCNALGLTKAPDANQICCDLEISKQKLRHYPGMKQRFGYEILKKRPSSYTEFMQAQDDEIESAIDAGIITL